LALIAHGSSSPEYVVRSVYHILEVLKPKLIVIS